MNDYEVSLHYPDTGNYFSGGRTFLKGGLSIEEAEQFGTACVGEADPKADIWITRSPVGEGCKWIKLIFMSELP